MFHKIIQINGSIKVYNRLMEKIEQIAPRIDKLFKIILDFNLERNLELHEHV